MYSIKKEFRFEAAHRLMLHKGACANIHGHSYRVEVVIEAPEVNENGMVIDFGELDSFKDYLNSVFDHSLMLNRNDFLWKSFPTNLRICVIENEPTAENLAREMYEWLIIQVSGVRSVTVYETQKCSATYQVNIE